MATLRWCKNQKNGIRIIEPNENLSSEYLKSAEETLGVLKDISSSSNMWLATAKYYCEYFAVYSLLMRLGIKSEIHECTIELCKFLEKENLIPKGTYSLLEKDKRLRIENQYYLKNIKIEINHSELVDFVLEIKNIIRLLTYDRIEEIRNKINSY